MLKINLNYTMYGVNCKFQADMYTQNEESKEKKQM